MKQILFLITALWIFTFSQENRLSAQVKETDTVATVQDKQIVEKVLFQLKEYQKLETGLLIIKVGEYFLETPYVANTLEVGGKEKMVINLREMDCTTFAENCLAIARTVQKENPTFNDFVEE